jgi:hypothetical protein
MLALLSRTTNSIERGRSAMPSKNIKAALERLFVARRVRVFLRPEFISEQEQNRHSDPLASFDDNSRKI